MNTLAEADGHQSNYNHSPETPQAETPRTADSSSEGCSSRNIQDLDTRSQSRGQEFCCMWRESLHRTEDLHFKLMLFMV